MKLELEVGSQSFLNALKLINAGKARVLVVVDKIKDQVKGKGVFCYGNDFGDYYMGYL